MPRFNPLNDRRYRNQGWLYRQHVINGTPMRKIARMCCADQATVLYWINKFNIQKQDYQELVGSERHTWRGGTYGYYHNLARKIWEDYWNQKIPKGQYVHHFDENIKNNNILNLVNATPKAHAILHKHKGAKISIYQRKLKYLRRCILVYKMLNYESPGWIGGLSCRAIAEMCNCHIHTIQKMVRKFEKLGIANACAPHKWERLDGKDQRTLLWFRSSETIPKEAVGKLKAMVKVLEGK